MRHQLDEDGGAGKRRKGRGPVPRPRLPPNDSAGVGTHAQPKILTETPVSAAATGVCGARVQLVRAIWSTPATL